MDNVAIIANFGYFVQTPIMDPLLNESSNYLAEMFRTNNQNEAMNMDLYIATGRSGFQTR